MSILRMLSDEYIVSFHAASTIAIAFLSQPRDRRQLLTTLHKLRPIHRGEAPVHPLNAPCNRCKYKERCEDSGGHRLSELL
jgi:hypothetical protein